MDQVETELVEVEDRRFFCPECGEAWDITIYPSENAERIECECERVYYWSRKLKTLFRADTEQPLDPGYMICYGTRLAPQLKTPELEKTAK